MAEECENINEEEIEIMSSRAMIYLPDNAVDVEITATIYQDGKLINVVKKMSMKEIQDAIKDAEENYIGPDDKFVLTEKGLNWLEELEAK